MRSAALVFTVATLLVAGDPSGAHAAMEDLGTLGGSWSDASAINDAGTVVGTSGQSGNTMSGFVYTDATGMVALPRLGGSYASARGINARGQVAGWSTRAWPNDVPTAFLWTPSGADPTVGTIVSLGTFGGRSSTAQAINDYGQVVGQYWVGSVGHAFLWTPNEANGSTGTVVHLGSLGGSESIAYDINSTGQVVGQSRLANGIAHAFVWTPTTPNGSSGVMVDLGGTHSQGIGINSLGDVVGSSQASFGVHGFLWRAGQAYDLSFWGGIGTDLELFSAVRAINDAGQIAGYGDLVDDDSYTPPHAFRLRVLPGPAPAGVVRDDLGTLGGDMSLAMDINSGGTVVGWSLDASGQSRAFRAAP